jgi:GMP synthase-like glutamine amidotransferase
MKPILVLQNLSTDGPGYLGTWLGREGLMHRVCNAGAGEEFPASMDPYAALAVLGGEMSANDELPSLRRAESLILQAMRDGKPVVGHCLGGQLMARALGVKVHASSAPEIGWQPLQLVTDEPLTRQWFGDPAADAGVRTVFQWHYESFELPPHARLLAYSGACAHQAFAIGPHLAMQFHVEIDADKVHRWSREESVLYSNALRRHATSVQGGDAMRSGASRHLPTHQALADRIYQRWIGAIAR